VHSTTQERPTERFAREQDELTPLPEQRFVGTKALTRKVSWDCLVPFRGNRYSVPAMYAGKFVWLLLSHGSSLVILNSRRELLVEHAIEPGCGKTIILPEHYEPLRRGTPRTWVVLAQRFLELFPHHADFLEGLTAQHKLNHVAHLRGVMQLASLYSDASLRWAFDVAAEYNTFSHSFVRGLLESGAAPVPTEPEIAMLALPDTSIRTDLKPYQQLLWAAGQ
jgi:Mu transposase, C-terminal domain